MAVRRETVAVTTASDGSATKYSRYLSGKLAAIHYVKTDYADTVDFTITAEATGETLWTEANVTASKACFPRVGVHSNAGVAALYASGGTPVTDMIRLGNDRVKIVLAAGGNAKTGTFIILVED